MIALRVFLPFSLGFFLSYAVRNVNAVIAPDLTASLSLTPADLGMLTSAYFLTFAAFQLPLGLLLDRYGPRRVEAALMVVAAAGCGIFALGLCVPALVIGRALIGLGMSACLMAAFMAYVQWFPAERLPIMNGATLAIGGFGALTATAPVEVLLSITDWRGVLLLTGTVSMTIIKSLSRTELALTLTVYTALFMSHIVLIPSIPVRENPSLVQLGWLFGVGAVGSVGHMAFVQAFKIAEMSAVLPLDFLRLLWASAYGYWLFAEVPSGWSWAGGVIVFSAATCIAFREAKLGRDKRRA